MDDQKHNNQLKDARLSGIKYMKQNQLFITSFPQTSEAYCVFWLQSLMDSPLQSDLQAFPDRMPCGAAEWIQNQSKWSRTSLTHTRAVKQIQRLQSQETAQFIEKMQTLPISCDSGGHKSLLF